MQYTTTSHLQDSTHKPRKSNHIFQSNWLSGKRDLDRNSAFIDSNFNPSALGKICDKVKDTSDCSYLLFT